MSCSAYTKNYIQSKSIECIRVYQSNKTCILIGFHLIDARITDGIKQLKHIPKSILVDKISIIFVFPLTFSRTVFDI